MLISIITATYDSEKTLKKTLKSVLDQRATDFEYIIIDGNSDDRTVEIIKEYCPKFKEKGIKFNYISEPDKGIYDAFNKGIELSCGKWITYLGSDDYYNNDNVIGFFSTKLKENYESDWVYSKIRLINKKGKELRVFNERWKWNKFKKHMYVPHAGSFHNRNYFLEYGFFDINFKVAGDYEVLLRKKKDLKTHFVDFIAVNMINSGISNNNLMMVLSEEAQAKLKHEVQSKHLIYIDKMIAYIKGFLRKKYYNLFR